jgi:hypothetical protein
MCKLARVLMTWPVVAQLIMGCCCAHHARLCGEFAHAYPATSALGRPAADQRQGPVGHKDQGHHDCHTGPCFSVLPGRVLSHGRTPLSSGLAVSAVDDSAESGRIPSAHFLCPADRPLPPIRSHLAHQVLLI